MKCDGRCESAERRFGYQTVKGEEAISRIEQVVPLGRDAVTGDSQT